VFGLAFGAALPPHTVGRWLVVRHAGPAGLVGLAGLAAFLANLGPIAGAAATPYLQLYPTTASVGQQVTAYGSDFCSTGCSPVTVSLGDKAVATGVAVGADGKFQAAFTVNTPPGRYSVTASQTGPGGAASSASAFLEVAATDSATSPKPGTPNPASPTPGGSPGPGASSATPSGFVQAALGTSSPAGWIALIVLGVAVLLAGVIFYRRLQG